MDRPSSAVSASDRLLVLVEADAALGDDLTMQMGYFGYTMRHFGSLEELRRELPHIHPAAILLDIALTEENLATVESLMGAARSGERRVPLVFLSPRDDLEARLQAVRAGADAYFTKPLDLGSLIDKLDQLTAPLASEPYRILVVDDQPDMTLLYTRILQRAGMKTAMVNDPMQVMGPLVDFKPDLILMDMYMPECSGMELAAVIRQQEAYVSVPIVFLSGETDITTQLKAMELGGDDFLTKQIKPQHLVMAVQTRVERLRTLRSFMVRDSLTGLLNHTVTKERLEEEVARAARHEGQVTFAILDIDHFKAVNDTYGHPMGDRVIKSLAHLLLQRVRKADIVGRYGGEEFAVVLPNASPAEARVMLDELRTNFAQIRHRHEQTDFHVTLSGGIAAFPRYADAPRLTDAADRALYGAKQGGRNRVLVAE